MSKKTNEQDVVEAKKKISEFKNQYHEAIQQYLDSLQTDENERILDGLIKVQQIGTNHFNFVEEFVGNSDLLGAHKNALWAQGFAEDCAAILEVIPSHFELIRAGYNEYSDVDLSNVEPSPTAYANMQRMAILYLNPDNIKNLKNSFSNSNLPVYGFNNKAKEFMSKKLQTILSFIFGVVFVIIMLITAFLQPNPSSYQYMVFRVVLSLAGGGIVAVFPGFIEVKFGNWLRAGGALAVFAIIYFLSPAALPQ